MRIKPNAPRFHALWQNREDRAIFLMKRESWDQLRLMDGEPVRLKLDKTSLNVLASNPSLIGAVANETPEHAKISIYRLDPKDAPTLINVDHYSVHRGLPAQLDVHEMIEAASTAADPNFQQYAEDHVFIVKDGPGSDHWLEQLPPEVAVLLNRDKK